MRAAAFGQKRPPDAIYWRSRYAISSVNSNPPVSGILIEKGFQRI
jgi:predicted lipoprotein